MVHIGQYPGCLILACGLCQYLLLVVLVLHHDGCNLSVFVDLVQLSPLVEQQLPLHPQLALARAGIPVVDFQAMVDGILLYCLVYLFLLLFVLDPISEHVVIIILALLVLHFLLPLLRPLALALGHALGLDAHLLFAERDGRHLAVADALRALGVVGLDVAFVFGLEELGDAVGIVVVVVVPALLHGVHLLGVDVGAGLVGGEVAVGQQLLLVEVSELLGRRPQLFVDGPALAAGLASQGWFGQDGLYFCEGLASERGSVGDHGVLCK